MNLLIEKLDAIPLASVLTVLTALGGVYALLTGQITYEQFTLGLGVSTAGNAALGHVRNKAGKGH